MCKMLFIIMLLLELSLYLSISRFVAGHILSQQQLLLLAAFACVVSARSTLEPLLSFGLNLVSSSGFVSFRFVLSFSHLDPFVFEPDYWPDQHLFVPAKVAPALCLSLSRTIFVCLLCLSCCCCYLVSLLCIVCVCLTLFLLFFYFFCIRSRFVFFSFLSLCPCRKVIMFPCALI